MCTAASRPQIFTLFPPWRGGGGEGGYGITCSCTLPARPGSAACPGWTWQCRAPSHRHWPSATSLPPTMKGQNNQKALVLHPHNMRTKQSTGIISPTYEDKIIRKHYFSTPAMHRKEHNARKRNTRTTEKPEGVMIVRQERNNPPPLQCSDKQSYKKNNLSQTCNAQTRKCKRNIPYTVLYM